MCCTFEPFLKFSRELGELCNILKAIYLQPLTKFELMVVFVFLTKYRLGLDVLANIFGDLKGIMLCFEFLLLLHSKFFITDTASFLI